MREKLSRNARRLVEKRYDWRTIGEQFVDRVEESIQRRKRRGGD
jgi:glycosyltransferase involved in cell wall biosynthesis